jgi:hypothetical protein
MKRFFIRLLILLNPIHPLKLSQKNKIILFRLFRKTKWFKVYWRHYLSHFGGSDFPVFVTNRDGSVQIGCILYYPANGNDYSKASVEIYKVQSRKYIPGSGVVYSDIILKYIDIVKYRK